MLIATINCKFRKPSTFLNVHSLLKSKNEDGVIDIYCINLQQIAYRGKRTFFSSDTEQEPGENWVTHLERELTLAQGSTKAKSKYVLLAKVIRHTCLSVVYARE